VGLKTSSFEHGIEIVLLRVGKTHGNRTIQLDVAGLSLNLFQFYSKFDAKSSQFAACRADASENEQKSGIPHNAGCRKF
jgi:hypothetical protein